MRVAKHRPTVATVDLATIRHNVDALRKHLGAGPEIWAVVKADAYGHGAVRVARAVSSLVNGYCVSNLDEALELREGQIDKPILVLSGIAPRDAALARAFDITLTAANLDWLTEVAALGKAVSGLKIHIKVDSGMGRIGVRTADEVAKMIATIDAASLDFDGIFTHFATADEENSEKYQQQVTAFAEIVDHLPRRPRYVHSTNSAAALWHKEQVQDIERFGIAMYGLNPSGETLELPFELEPALSLTSELTMVKKLSAGDSVGYGADFVAAEDTVVGTLPIGYADGWTRSMTGFHVLVDGEFCEIIGRVSMDQTTIKLAKAYPLGTKVTLIGTDGDKIISAQEVADYRGTISYEVLCGLTDRIVRDYINEQ